MDGHELKREGIDRINLNPEIAPWRVVARAAIARLASSGLDFTSEDVTGAVGQPPHPNAVGAALNAASRRGIIYRVGFHSAERPNQHAALISVWRGTGKEDDAVPISPLRPGTPPPEEMWVCMECKGKSLVQPPKTTVDERYRRGYCLPCRKERLWKRE